MDGGVGIGGAGGGHVGPSRRDPGLAYCGSANRNGWVSVVKLTDEGEELVRQVEGDLWTRLTKLVADWPADKRGAVGDVLAELVGTIRAGMAVRDEASGRVAQASRAGTVRAPARCGGWITHPIRRRRTGPLRPSEPDRLPSAAR